MLFHNCSKTSLYMCPVHLPACSVLAADSVQCRLVEARTIFPYFKMGNCIKGLNCSVDVSESQLKKTVSNESKVNQHFVGIPGQIGER